MSKSGIHINPKNKGKFNALKKKTGKSTAELTHSKNPLTRKRAIFAQNAKKWHHEDGGYMYDLGGNYLSGDYDIGGWLGHNVGNIAQTIGGVALIATGAGAPAGVGMLASGVGGFAKSAGDQKMEDQQNELNQNNADQQIGQQRLAQYNNQQMLPTFANGGSMVDNGLGSYTTNDYWPRMMQRIMANGGHLPEGNSTLKEAKEFLNLYPDEMKAGTEVEYEHTGNKKLAQRIAADHIKDHLTMTNGDPGYYKALQQAGISDELNKMPQMAMGGKLSPDKAKEILKDGTIRGKKITDKQRKYFGLVASGKQMPDGGKIPTAPRIEMLPPNPDAVKYNQFFGPMANQMDRFQMAGENNHNNKMRFMGAFGTRDLNNYKEEPTMTSLMGRQVPAMDNDAVNFQNFVNSLSPEQINNMAASKDMPTGIKGALQMGLKLNQIPGAMKAASFMKKNKFPDGGMIEGNAPVMNNPPTMNNTNINIPSPTLLPKANEQWDKNLSMNSGWVGSLQKGKSLDEINNTVVGTYQGNPLTMGQMNTFPQYVRNGFNSDFTMEQQKMRLGLPNNFQEMNMRPSPGRAGNVQPTYLPKSEVPGGKAYMAKGGYFGTGSMSGSVGSVPSFNDQNPVTMYKGGGTHQQNPLGGIPIGKSKVENGEVRVDFEDGSYIFSDRY